MIYKKELTSKCVCEARYDDATSTLTVVMTRNEQEIKYTCPKSVYDKLTTASSPGWVYNSEIRSIYPYNPPKEASHENLVGESNRKGED